MEKLGQQFLSFILTAILCGIASSIAPKGSKQWLKLLCGLVLTIALLSSFTGVRDLTFDSLESVLWQEGSHYAQEGQEIAQDSVADIIRRNTQAYIMDKANEVGVPIQAEVEVSKDTIPVPVSVRIFGTVSPYAKLQIESIIQRDLGITKENIQWMQ